MSHVIRFAFPEGGVYAGWTRDGALGYAPTIKTAARFDDRQAAERTLENSYGPEIRSYGKVERVELADNDRHSRKAPDAD